MFNYLGGCSDSEWNFYNLADPRNLSELPALESETSAAQRNNQAEQGLKILTPNKMLSRLPITLAQLQAGNTSQKRDQTIILYSLYRSKKLTKAINNNLINAA